MVAPLLPSEVHSNQSDLQQTLKATQLVTVIRHWRESPRCSGAEEGEGPASPRGVMGVLWICATCMQSVSRFFMFHICCV